MSTKYTPVVFYLETILLNYVTGKSLGGKGLILNGQS